MNVDSLFIAALLVLSLVLVWVISSIIVWKFAKYLERLSGYDMWLNRSLSTWPRIFAKAPFELFIMLSIRHVLEFEAYFGFWPSFLERNVSLKESWKIERSLRDWSKEQSWVDKSLKSAAELFEEACDMQQTSSNGLVPRRFVAWAKRHFWSMHGVAARHGFEVRRHFMDYLSDTSAA